MRITRPLNGAHVNKRTIVVKGRSKDQKPVQVYVLANDGVWYLQPPVKWNTRFKKRWSVDVWLGTLPMWEWEVGNSAYKIIAVQTSERPETPLNVLPTAPKSKVVKVFVKE